MNKTTDKKLGDKYTCEEIIRTLREMDMRKVGEHGYIPSYTRTQVTASLHENAGFRTDYELGSGIDARLPFLTSLRSITLFAR